MKNKITFLYGLGQRKEYRHLFKYFTVPKIDWNKGTITPKIGKVDTLIGFSMGCMLAIMHAEKYKVKHLILCSPSPGEESLSKVRASRITFLVGEKETYVLQDLLRISNSTNALVDLVVIKNGTHNINNGYLNKLLELI